MSTSSPSPRGRLLPSSSIIESLYGDEDIEDVAFLSGAAVPEWLKQLSIPTNWRLLDLPASPGPALARIVVFGSLGNGEWEAADMITVIGFTGWPAFYDVYRSANSVLRALDSTNNAVEALPVPPLQWTAAFRSSGTAVLGNRSVWLQQSHYVAGSEQPHASRLIVHTVLAGSARQEQLAENIIRLSGQVYHGFLNTLTEKRRSH